MVDCSVSGWWAFRDTPPPRQEPWLHAYLKTSPMSQSAGQSIKLYLPPFKDQDPCGDHSTVEGKTMESGNEAVGNMRPLRSLPAVDEYITGPNLHTWLFFLAGVAINLISKVMKVRLFTATGLQGNRGPGLSQAPVNVSSLTGHTLLLGNAVERLHAPAQVSNAPVGEKEGSGKKSCPQFTQEH